jgi:hypothetical protein
MREVRALQERRLLFVHCRSERVLALLSLLAESSYGPVRVDVIAERR